MIVRENDCVNCRLPCLGHSCPYQNVPHFYCDECGNEEELYEFENKQICENCLLSKFPKVVY